MSCYAWSKTNASVFKWLLANNHKMLFIWPRRLAKPSMKMLFIASFENVATFSQAMLKNWRNSEMFCNQREHFNRLFRHQIRRIWLFSRYFHCFIRNLARNLRFQQISRRETKSREEIIFKENISLNWQFRSKLSENL